MDNEVITAVLSVYGITLKDLVGKSRKRYIVEARKMASLFLAKKMRQVDIAELLNFDRSNVVYNIKTIESDINLYSKVAERYERIYSLIEPSGELEILKHKRSQLEKSLVDNPTSPPDFRYAQIQELNSINDKISNLLKVEL